MKSIKFIDKLFGRKIYPVELTIILLGLISSILYLSIILTDLGYLSVTSPQKLSNPLDITIFIVGITLISLFGFYFYKRENDFVWLVIILLLSSFILIKTFFPLATVFNPSNELGILPTTIDECKDFNGILIPPSVDCPINHLESSNVEGFICCIPDNCNGSLIREYNPQTKLYEVKCEL